MYVSLKISIVLQLYHILSVLCEENKELIKFFQSSSEIPNVSLICVFCCNLYSLLDH